VSDKPAEQPALFTHNDIPNAEELSKEVLRTGKIVTKDERRVNQIAECYLRTGSLSRTARECQCDTRTVHAVMRALEDAGKLTGVKERLSKQLGMLAEVTAELAVERVMEGRVPDNVLPIMMGVALDKKAQLDGEATLTVEVRHVLSVDDLAERARQLRERMRTVAVDVQSSVVEDKQQ
jgi:hypothetical protein